MFENLWNYITKDRQGVVTVQEYKELEHVFNLMRDCNSYLEVGTAEGNSLYVLSQALAKEAKIVSVDFGEKHTVAHQKAIQSELADMGINVVFVSGNSHDHTTLPVIHQHPYDVVLIDAGHSYADVIADAVMYGKFATKYIVFHDVMLPEVSIAFEWYANQRRDWTAYKFVNSEKFGYGVLVCK